MTKTTTRIATLAAAMLFGAATVLPLTATPSLAQQKPATGQHMAKRHMAHKAASDPEVMSAQDALNKQGAGLTADGKMGPKTRAAVKSFQQAHGLKATGKLDQATKTALGLS
jgi:peptidoglycan hydrolase-like protein with peptidoglycan-binding domain